jgi:hypothetical protein
MANRNAVWVTSAPVSWSVSEPARANGVGAALSTRTGAAASLTDTSSGDTGRGVLNPRPTSTREATTTTGSARVSECRVRACCQYLRKLSSEHGLGDQPIQRDTDLSATRPMSRGCQWRTAPPARSAAGPTPPGRRCPAGGPRPCLQVTCEGYVATPARVSNGGRRYRPCLLTGYRRLGRCGFRTCPFRKDRL